MPKYMLVLYLPPVLPTDLSPADEQAITDRYRQWIGRVAGGGHLEGSERLEDGQGRVLKLQGARLTVTDGPFTEAKEVVGGYFLINAASYDEVIELCRDCPHLDFGTIEIRATKPIV